MILVYVYVYVYVKLENGIDWLLICKIVNHNSSFILVIIEEGWGGENWGLDSRR